MSEEIEPADKTQYLEAFADLRPDLFFPQDWTPEQKGRATEEMSSRKTRTAMYSSIPMQCNGPACQPAGTLVKTYYGDIPIEDLDPSRDLLVAWDRRQNTIRGGHQNGNVKGYSFVKAERQYTGVMNEVCVGDRFYQATHDHLVPVRWNDAARTKYAVYLMRKGDHWRVGKTRLLNSKGRFGVAARARCERADEFWVLGVYDTDVEAYLHEERFSLDLKAPRSLFLATDRSKNNGFTKWVTQEQLDDHHANFAWSKEEMGVRLNELGLCVNCSFWGQDTSSTGQVMVIRACNIISGCMETPTSKTDLVNRAHKAVWGTVHTKWWTVEDLTVYSLGVEKYKTYIANGLVTHNCPYAAVCPLLAENNAPIGHKCPIEMGIVIEFGNNLMREFGVDPTNLVEVSMVRDLVDFEVQYMRAMKILAQEHFISEVPVGVDANGEVIVGKQLHQAVEYEEKILKRKERLLNAFLATREARTKAGQGQLDASVQVANLLDTVREHKARADKLALEKLGVPTRDAYIEADAAAREEMGEESDE